MKLRLLVLPECNRTCKGCCNKNFDLDALPVVETFKGFDEIILTGGEPMLDPMVIYQLIKKIRYETTAPIYMYTAWRENALELAGVVARLDGLTITLHTKKDTEPFERLCEMLKRFDLLGQRSLRVNVFSGVSTGNADLTNWQVKTGLKWVENCPIPEGEVFMRLRDSKYDSVSLAAKA